MLVGDTVGETERQFSYLLRFFTPRTVFMEVVSAGCELSFRAATYVERVWCVGAPARAGRGLRAPCNLRLLHSGGLQALPPESIDVAFSEGVKEVRAVERVLAPGGVYVCAVAPSGPFARWRSGFRIVARK